MNIKFIKNTILIVLFLLIGTGTFFIISYQKKIYEVNKELFNKTVFQEADTHFEYFKVIRAWNSNYDGVYVKEQEGIEPNKYLKNNHIFTKDNEMLIKINPAWMTRQISEMMNDVSKYNYKITSLNPLNPDNKAVGFEKEALEYFEKEKNSDKYYYTSLDEKNKVYNFMGKLLVKESCLQCHASQGYKLGEVRGGIRVTIPLEVYGNNLDELGISYKTHILAVLVFAFFLLVITYLIIEKIYKNHINLKELKDKYKILYDRYDYAVVGSELGLWDWNLVTNEVYFSRIWKKLLGYKEDEVVSKLEFWENNVHPDDKEKAISDILANQNKQTEYYENIHRLRHKNGSWVWILDKGKTIFDEKGKPIRMVGFHTDITKMQELKEELNKLKLAIEHSPISIVITDEKGDIEYINPHFTKVSGYKYNEVRGKNPRVLKSEFTSDFEYKQMWDTLLSQKTWRGIFKNIDKDKKEFWESAIITPIINNKGKTTNFLAIKQEITKEIYLKEELKNKEEMMIAQSRHAAMGEMISMIAHQWRQPISVIAMAANNTLVDIELEMVELEELKDNTEAILEQTKYLSQTIEDFRDFFRPNKEKEITTSKIVLEESLKIMDKALENNEIEFNIVKFEDYKIKIYSRELLQVYLNIMKNAKEALAQNRKENRQINVEIYKVNNYVRTVISDNAGGIKESIIDKLFDPYFSTKNEKTGTGLGLYMCKTIIEKHFEGQIGVYNCNDGACFYVDIPIYCEEN